MRTYAEREGGLARVRRLRDSDSGFDQQCWSKLGALGWLGLRVPEPRGGSGLGLAEMSVLARELGRTLVPELVIPAAVMSARLLCATETDRGAQLLAGLVDAALLPAAAWQEGIGAIDASAVATQAKRNGTGWELQGRKQCVVAGAAADGFLVSARDTQGIGLYWVARACPGAHYHSLRRADGSEHGTLMLDRVRLDPNDCLLAPGRAETVLAAAIDEALIAAASELLGVAERALDITVEYLRTRTQFGKAIGAFQALQHRAVDMFMHKELGVSALGAGLSEWEHAAAVRRSALASRVKARCADAALDICRKSIQMHGAIGFTDECDIGLYLKRALVLAAWLGNASTHRRRYAQLVLRGPDASHALGLPGRAA